MAEAPAGALLVLSILATSFLPLAGPAFAQPRGDEAALPAAAPRRNNWVVTPSLKLAESYTDNVFLSPSASRQSEWITQVIPGISVTANGPRLRLDAAYAPEFVYRAETKSEDKVFHRGNALGTLEVADELLFVDAGARVDQYDVSLRGPLTTSNVNITGNRATVATSHVSPYLLRNIGSAARAEARFTYSTWDSDNNQGTLPDNTARRVLLRVASGPAYRLSTWDVAYSAESIEYETQQKTTSEEFIASGQRRITGAVSLLALAGYERYDTGLGTLAEPRWSAGIEWTPTVRTRLAATAGQRLNGDSYSLHFTHRTRLSTWNVTYAEDITTPRQQFFVPATQSTAGALEQIFLSRYPDPVARQKAVQDFIARMGLPTTLDAPINFFSDQLFLQKRWLTSVALQGTRNTVVATAFWESRELARGTVPVGDFAASQSIRTNGGSLAWGLRLTPRTTWNAQAGYTRAEFLDSGQVDDFAYLQAGLTREFQPRVSGSLSYRRQAKDSTQSGAEYRENAAIASVLVTF
jgi:uncharacterized protein (PEP-CTERM system associated)